MSDAAGFYLILFIVLLGLANVPARIASDKGYSYSAFYLFGLALFIPALIVSLLIQDKGQPDNMDTRSTADELLKYKQLLDAGAISSAEYHAIKENLLSGKRPAHFENGSPRHGEYAAASKTEEIRKTAQNLSVAALVLAAICLAFTRGFELLLAPPIDSSKAPDIPAFAQSAFCSMVSGALLLLATRKKKPRAALFGIVFALVTCVLWLVGLFGSIMFCSTYGVDVFRYWIQTHDIGFSTLFLVSIACSATSALLFYRNASAWGIDMGKLDLQKSGIIGSSKVRIVAACLAGLAVVLLCIGIFTSQMSSNSSPSRTGVEQSAEEQGEAFITAMRPYLSHLGKEAVDGSISMPQRLIDGSDKVELCGVQGTVSHKFNEESSDTVSICDWISNDAVDEDKYDEAVEALRTFFGWAGESGTSEPTPEFGSFDYVQWNDTETDGMVTVFMDESVLHVRWWPGNETGSDSYGSNSSVSRSNDSNSYSRSASSEDHASGSDYEHLYDEESGIYGVYDSENGDGLFAGDDFAMRLNDDGTGVATDGKGNWVADTDGDGEVDSISIDGGNSWINY